MGFVWKLEVRGHDTSRVHTVGFYAALRKEMIEGKDGVNMIIG